MNLRHRTFALAALTTLVFAAAPAFAQEELETPTVNVIGQKPSSVRLMVTAGATGAPNGFAVDWMTKSDFDALQGWPVDPSGPMVRSLFVGVPTFNIEGTSNTYTLLAGAAIEVELGQLFDETGVSSDFVDEMNAGTEYVVRVRALGGSGESPSVNTTTIVVESSISATNCTYTLGYWKTHPETWVGVSVQLGNIVYNQADLLDILNEPAHGNGLLILMHQLIAAKLNIQNGANPSAVSATIAAADVQIGDLVPPPLGSDSLPSSSVNSKSNLLDDYNNGVIGPGHCGTVPAKPATWGNVKAIYRN